MRKCYIPCHVRSEAVPLPFHYAWVIVATGTLCIVACLGFGRFALGMLLPSMASTLKLSYSQIGFISTGNFVGYLAAVLFCGRHRGKDRLAPADRGCACRHRPFDGAHQQGDEFAAVLVLYLITGMGSGAANVPVMGLITPGSTARSGAALLGSWSSAAASRSSSPASSFLT